MLSTRQKTFLLNIVASPFFLALPIVILIIIFIPNPSSKYRIQLNSKQVGNKPNSRVQFCDLNGDGNDERIITFHNLVKGKSAIKILTNDGINYDAWNFNGYFQKSSGNVFCADLDEDGYSEIYTFYYRDDSVFMDILQPYPNKKKILQEKLITTVRKRDGSIDFIIGTFKVCDIDQDGNKDLLFSFRAGYSRQPRFLIAYLSLKEELLKSSSFGANLSQLEVIDFENEIPPAIFCATSTPGNIPDSMGIPYSDYDSWYFGFSNNFKFLFNPIKNSRYPSNTNICKFESDEGGHFIVVSFIAAGKKSNTVKFYKNGIEEYSSMEYSNEGYSDTPMLTLMVPVIFNGKNYLLMGIVDDKFILINEKLVSVEKKVEVEVTSLNIIDDLNKDGLREYIFLSSDNKIVIYDNNLENPTSFETGIQPFLSKGRCTGIKHNANQHNQFYLKTDSYLHLYAYNLDKMYYLKYPLWIMVYILVAFALWLAQRMQKINLKRKQHIEDTINSLQMKTIKSQMDPHFMFNVLNGLANNVAIGNTKEAHDQIMRFSILLRSMMKRTDKVDIRLGEEIEFVRSYLELEKFRFKDDFEFEINIDEDVDKNIRLPRMLIQLLVENSIKHGLRNKAGVKKLWVKLNNVQDKIEIIVEDNGVGRKEAMKKTRDTGKGIKLIKDMIRLNRKLGGNEIILTYTDLYNKTGKASGTRVEVNLSQTK